MERPRIESFDLASLPRINPLFRDYSKGVSPLRDFYQWEPRQGPEPLAAILAHRAYPREEITAILTTQNRAFGAPEGTLARLQCLRDPQAVVVVTGQQVGLFGGPLYCLYKALTVLVVAEQLESRLQIPCLPLFWMASEDADLAEIDHLALPDPDDRITRLKYIPARGFGTDLPATHLLGPEIDEALKTLEHASSGGASSRKALTLLQKCYRPGITMTSAFGRLFTALLGDQGLILVDPADPELKALARPLFLQEIETAPTSSHLVQNAWEKLKGLGYRPQIRLRGEGPNLFSLEEGRRSLTKGPHLKNLSGEVLRRLSPNVVLRPLMQDFLFPTVSYVGGPNEIAYYAQLRGVYDHFSLPMPFILPRASLTVVEGRIERLLKKHALGFLDLWGDHEGVVNQVLRRSLPKAFLAKREKGLERIQESFRELKEMVSTLDPTVAPRVGAAEGVVKKQLEELERILLRSFKRRNQEVRTQVLRILTHLLPDGELQERVYGFMPYVIRHGFSFLDLLKDGIDGLGWEHRVIYLGASKGDS